MLNNIYINTTKKIIRLFKYLFGQISSEKVFFIKFLLDVCTPFELIGSLYRSFCHEYLNHLMLILF